MPDFIEICDVPAEDLRTIVEQARVTKQARLGQPNGSADAERPLAGHIAALVFERPSTRTRVSFETGIRQLGGEAMFLSGSDLQTGRGESAADTARVLAKYVDLVILRASGRLHPVDYSRHSDVPVINGLTEQSHPCQVLADIMTFEEHRGDIAGCKVTWFGAGNNVCNSFVQAAAKFDFNLVIAAPEGFEPDSNMIESSRQAGANVSLERDPEVAAVDSELIVTDVWSSMHDPEITKDDRCAALKPYSVTDRLMRLARPNALFMHCLPANRGQEVAAEVIDGPQSVIFDEAENRLHAQKAIMRWCVGA